MAAEYSALEELHEILTQAMREELMYYRQEKIPVPAADKAVIAKFLKDNAVVSTPKSKEDLQKLREDFKKSPRGERLAKLREAIDGSLNDDSTVIRLQ